MHKEQGLDVISNVQQDGESNLQNIRKKNLNIRAEAAGDTSVRSEDISEFSSAPSVCVCLQKPNMKGAFHHICVSSRVGHLLQV